MKKYITLSIVFSLIVLAIILSYIYKPSLRLFINSNLFLTNLFYKQDISKDFNKEKLILAEYSEFKYNNYFNLYMPQNWIKYKYPGKAMFTKSLNEYILVSVLPYKTNSQTKIKSFMKDEDLKFDSNGFFNEQIDKLNLDQKYLEGILNIQDSSKFKEFKIEKSESKILEENDLPPVFRTKDGKFTLSKETSLNNFKFYIFQRDAGDYFIIGFNNQLLIYAYTTLKDEKERDLMLKLLTETKILNNEIFSGN